MFREVPSYDSSSMGPLETSMTSFSLDTKMPSSFLTSDDTYGVTTLCSSVIVVHFIMGFGILFCVFYCGLLGSLSGGTFIMVAVRGWAVVRG